MPRCNLGVGTAASHRGERGGKPSPLPTTKEENKGGVRRLGDAKMPPWPTQARGKASIPFVKERGEEDERRFVPRSLSCAEGQIFPPQQGKKT